MLKPSESFVSPINNQLNQNHPYCASLTLIKDHPYIFKFIKQVFTSNSNSCVANARNRGFK